MSVVQEDEPYLFLAIGEVGYIVCRLISNLGSIYTYRRAGNFRGAKILLNKFSQDLNFAILTSVIQKCIED